MESLSLAFSQPFNVRSNDSEDECDEHDEDEEDEDGFSDGKFAQSTPQGFLTRSSSSNRHAREAAGFSHLWAHRKLGSLTLKNFIPSMSPPLSSLYKFTIQLGDFHVGYRIHSWDIRPLLDLLDGMKGLRELGIDLLSTTIQNPSDENAFDGDDSVLPVALPNVTTVRFKIDNCYQTDIELILCFIELPNVQHWEITLLPLRDDQEGSDGDGFGECASLVLDPTVYLEEFFPKSQRFGFPRVTSVSIGASGFESRREFNFPFHKFPNLMHLKLEELEAPLGTGSLNKDLLPALRSVHLAGCHEASPLWVERLVKALHSRSYWDTFQKLIVDGCGLLSKDGLKFISPNKLKFYQ